MGQAVGVGAKVLSDPETDHRIDAAARVDGRRQLGEHVGVLVVVARGRPLVDLRSSRAAPAAPLNDELLVPEAQLCGVAQFAVCLPVHRDLPSPLVVGAAELQPEPLCQRGGATPQLKVCRASIPCIHQLQTTPRQTSIGGHEYPSEQWWSSSVARIWTGLPPAR